MMILLNGSCGCFGWHPLPSLVPFPMSPSGQKHSKEPEVSLQCSSLSQLCWLRAHSGMSTKATQITSSKARRKKLPNSFSMKKAA